MTYIIAEIGINHNGSLENAKNMISAAKLAGCDCVKFQKREPELCVPRDQWDNMRDTPWGRITYLEYRHKVEFGETEFDEIDAYCRSIGIDWTASAWDHISVKFVNQYDVPFMKAPSAMLTNHELLTYMQATEKPLMISTGMSTLDEIDAAVNLLGQDGLMIAHCTSTYPTPPSEVNLYVITSLKKRYPRAKIGFSGHESGLPCTSAAVALGAEFVERHITLDRTMWGTDQAASLEPDGISRLVKHIRTIEKAIGDGEKVLYDSELPAREKLRGGQ